MQSLATFEFVDRTRGTADGTQSDARDIRACTWAWLFRKYAYLSITMSCYALVRELSLFGV